MNPEQKPTPELRARFQVAVVALDEDGNEGLRAHWVSLAKEGV